MNRYKVICEVEVEATNRIDAGYKGLALLTSPDQQEISVDVYPQPGNVPEKSN